jgi:hypothetical protein
MPEYILYCFASYKLDQCDRFEAVDDSKAKEEALRRHDGRAAELWCGPRKVTNLEAQDTFKT